MTPVFQSIVDKGRGDCMRAAVASLFDLELVQVPHFILFERYFEVYWAFLRGIGYSYKGCGYPTGIKMGHDIKHHGTIGGYVYGVVNSKTFPGVTHAVVLDENGVVVHDPNPNQKWLGINTIETGELQYWHILGKLEEGE